MTKKNLITTTLFLLALLFPFGLVQASRFGENPPSQQESDITDEKIRLLGKLLGGPNKKSLLMAEGYYQNGKLTIDFDGLIANENVSVIITTYSGALLLSDVVAVDSFGRMELYIDLTGYEGIWLEITSADYSFSGEL